MGPGLAGCLLRLLPPADKELHPGDGDDHVDDNSELDIAAVRSGDVRYQHPPAPRHSGQSTQRQQLRLLVGEYQQRQISLLPDERLPVTLSTEQLPEEVHSFLMRILGNVLKAPSETTALTDGIVEGGCLVLQILHLRQQQLFPITGSVKLCLKLGNIALLVLNFVILVSFEFLNFIINSFNLPHQLSFLRLESLHPSVVDVELLVSTPDLLQQLCHLS